MFGMGMPEILLIMAVALIVIGPKKLPGLAKTIGRAMGEFRNATRDFKRSIDLDGDLQDVKDSMNGLKDIPTYDPDKSAYTAADTTRTDEPAAESESGSQEAGRDDNENPASDSETDAPSSSGAKSHG